MNILAWDSETALFRPGVMAPEAVCFTWQRPGEAPQIIHAEDPATLPLVRGWLTDPKLLLVGHHVAYDFAVLCARWAELVPLVFAAYDADRVTCTKLRFQLLDIAAGQFRGYLHKFEKPVCSEHEDCDAETCPKATIKKSGRWMPHDYSLDARATAPPAESWTRTPGVCGTASFCTRPLAEWPEGARTYPLEDARATLDVVPEAGRARAVHPRSVSSGAGGVGACT